MIKKTFADTMKEQDWINVLAAILVPSLDRAGISDESFQAFHLVRERKPAFVGDRIFLPAS